MSVSDSTTSPEPRSKVRLSMRDGARYAGCSPRHFYKLTYASEIPSYLAAGHRWVDQEDIDAYFERQKAAGSQYRVTGFANRKRKPGRPQASQTRSRIRQRRRVATMSKPQHAEIDAFLAEHQRDLRFTGTHWVRWNRRCWEAVEPERLAEISTRPPPPETKRPSEDESLGHRTIQNDERPISLRLTTSNKGGRSHARST